VTKASRAILKSGVTKHKPWPQSRWRPHSPICYKYYKTKNNLQNKLDDEKSMIGSNFFLPWALKFLNSARERLFRISGFHLSLSRFKDTNLDDIYFLGSH